MAEAVKKIRMLIKVSGTREGQDWPDKGGEIAVPAAEAADLIRAGYAKDPAAVETATVQVPGLETAVMPKPGRKPVRGKAV